MTVTDFLKSSVPFLNGITEDQAAYLAKAAEQNSYKMGQTVIFKGVSVEGLHVVAQGKVSVHIKPPKAKEMIKVAELGPGEVFGETSIMEFTMATATIRSQANDTLIFVLPQAPFRKILETDPDLKTRTMALIEARKARKGPDNKKADAPQGGPHAQPAAQPQPAEQPQPPEQPQAQPSVEAQIVEQPPQGDKPAG